MVVFEKPIAKFEYGLKSGRTLLINNIVSIDCIHGSHHIICEDGSCVIVPSGWEYFFSSSDFKKEYDANFS